MLSRKPYRLQGISAWYYHKIFAYASSSKMVGPLTPLVLPFLRSHISIDMNPYEIIRDAVLKTDGMSVKAFVILVLAMTVVFTVLI